MTKAPHRAVVTASYESRPGEGSVVSLTPKMVTTKSGAHIQVLQANMAAAPVPDRKYAANVANAALRRGEVELMFGQERVGSVGLRSLVLVSIGATPIRAFLASLDRMGDGKVKLSDIARNAGTSPEQLVDIHEEPLQTILLRANQIVVAIADDEVCLDFFQASAFSVHDAQRTHKLSVDAIVRIEFRLSLLLGLVKRLTELERQLPTDRIGILEEVPS
jgi:hypothetical protein